VRIFTPAQEIPFAGHPNVGTAFVLGTIGELGELRSSQVVTFEEKAGLVPIQIESANGKVTSCELTAPAPLSLGETVPVELVATAVSLNEKDIATQAHPPQLVSVGLPFIITELKDRATLERVKINTAGFEKVRDYLAGEAVRASIYLYTRATGEVNLRARMLAPLGASGAEVTAHVVAFVDNLKVSVLGAIGFVALFYTVLSVIERVESALNNIWHVRRPRSLARA